jgi:hypothetical protein
VCPWWPEVVVVFLSFVKVENIDSLLFPLLYCVSTIFRVDGGGGVAVGGKERKREWFSMEL